MSKRFSTALCLAVLVLGAALPVSANAVDPPTTPVTGTTGAVPTDSSADQAPLSMTPEQIAALTGTTDTGDTDKSFFDKASDFVTDNAPFIIIGIIVLAAILAGIFIVRGRSKTPKGAAGTAGAAGSASEIRRRKRAAMQRSREEERLRRKAGLDDRRGTKPGVAMAPYPGVPLDPVEAEKQSARDQLQAASAVARSGPIPAYATAVPAPASPSQTAPAAGVVQPGYSPEPETYVYSPPSPVAETAPAAEPSPATDLEPEPESAPVAADSSTGILAQPDALDDPPVEAPAVDARVGEAAAAFAAGTIGGGAIAHAATSNQDDREEIEDEAASETEPVADPADDAARDAEQRLKAKVAEIKAEQGRGLAAHPVPPVVAPVTGTELEVTEPGPGESIEEQLADAEEIQREIDSATVIPPTPTGLEAVEARLAASSEERDRTLQDAEQRLRQIEQRAADAERRAAFAERLAQLKIDETDRERRLQDVISGIDRAEERAIEAEHRAKAAETAAASALEETGVPTPRPPAVPPHGFSPPRSPISPPNPSPVPDPGPDPEPAYEPEPDTPRGPAADDPSFPPAPRSPLFGGSTGSAGRPSPGSLNLNSATFEQLRDADLSVTQATRILAYRERFGGYRSVEDLEKVPGFPAELIESLRGRITV